jgi:hypothetical protein
MNLVVMVMVGVVVGQQAPVPPTPTNGVYVAAASSIDSQSQPYYGGGYYPGSPSLPLPITGYRAHQSDLINGFDDPNDDIDGANMITTSSPSLDVSLPLTVPYDSEEDFFGRPTPQRLVEDPNVFAPVCI